jgi:hypothetical protein
MKDVYENVPSSAEAARDLCFPALLPVNMASGS